MFRKDDPVYQATLSNLREIANEKIPGVVVLHRSDVMKITGESHSTVWRKRDLYGFQDGTTTIELLAKGLSYRPKSRY